MKSLILAFLIIIIAITPCLADGILYRYNQNNVSVVGYTGNDTVVNIPDSVNGLPVASIDDGAFQNSSVEELTLPKRLISIGCSAFKGCNNLCYINLPASVKNIANNSFDGCTALTAFVDKYSFAYGFCLENGIPCQYLNDDL